MAQGRCEVKRCARCHARFKQRKAESNYAFERRVHCSQRCEAATRNAVLDAQRRSAAEFAWAAGLAHLSLRKGGAR